MMRRFWICGSFIALFASLPFMAQAQTAVTLQPTASPTSGTPGVTTVSVTGSGFPSGVTAANVQVTLTAPGAGAFATSPTSLATVIGTTKRVSFLIPAGISVGSPTPFAISVANVVGTTPAFASSNTSQVTVTPAPSISGLSPAAGPQGGNVAVVITGSFTSFTSVTTVSFGSGISVGGAAEGAFGPVTVSSAASITAALSIDAAAALGARTVSVQTGTQQLALTNGFTVNSAPPQSYGVTLTSPANPPSGLPGTAVTVVGTNFPPASYTINNTAVSIAVTPATSGSGPSMTLVATAVSAASGSNNTRSVQFTIPSTVSVPANTPYLITISGATTDNTPFASVNNAAFTLLTQQSGPPIANAGSNQTVNVATLVTLNGSASSDPGGHTLTYSWSFASIPSGSSATLTNPTSVNPTFVPDRIGSYQVQLIVNNGTQNSTPSSVTISTQPVPPVANAGSNQTVNPKTLVTLDGSHSTDAAGLPLTYLWSFTSTPSGTAAVLSNPTAVNPTFTVDRAGNYVVQLVVNNGYFNSPAASVTITTNSVPPVSNPGPNQIVNVGATVHLDGSASSDANGLPLSYQWSFMSIPTGSAAVLTNPTLVNPTFVADTVGSYVVQLVVNDGVHSSSPVTVTVTTNDVAPTANAGPNQSLNVATTVYLNGSGSTTPSNRTLTYQWSILTKPSGSSATLSNATLVNPTFFADSVGTYVAQLVVSDGILSSIPSTVMITSNDVAPVANPGQNQSNIALDAIVQLNGSGSTDVDGNPLTYAWTMLTLPQGSTASLSNTTIVNPTFTVDRAGTYVVQLLVNDGFLNSVAATVTITTATGVPVANPGSNQQVNNGAVVTLDGTGSTDPNGYSLTYSWLLISKRSQSAAALSSSSAAKPTFTVDKEGAYVAQLTVSDPIATSQPATVTISTNNVAPVANPGSAQNVYVNSLVTLHGENSTSSSGYPLTYSWSLLSKPTGSAATLTGAATANPTFTPDQPGSYVAQLIVNDSIQNSAPATVTITAAYSNVVTVTLNNYSLSTFSSTTGNVHINVPATNTGVNGCPGQVVQLSLDNAPLAVISTATQNPADHVCILAGAQDASFTLTSSSVTGSATITGFASQFQNGTAGVSVTASQVTMSLGSIVAQGRSIDGSLTLASPAQCPSSGTLAPCPITIALASTQTSLATVSPLSVTIPANGTTASFTVSGASPGSSTITATSPAGYTSPSSLVTVASPALTITIPSGLTVAPGQSLPFPVSIGAAAASPVTITFTQTGGAGTATVSPSSVTIPTGSTTPATQPQIIGGNLGNVSITASAPNYGPDTETENVSVTLTLTPSPQTVLTYNTVEYTLSASAQAPAGGWVVNTSIDDTTKATVSPQTTIPVGTSSTTVTVTGVAAGATTLRASGTGFVAASAGVTVVNAPATSFYQTSTVSTISLGKDEQQSLGLTVATAAPAGNTTVTITSADPTKVLLSASSTAPGSNSITVQINAGSTTSPTFYVQGLTPSGSTLVTTHATGYADGSLTVNLIPTGFYVTGGTTTTTFSTASNVYVYFAELNATTLNIAYPDEAYLRPGAASVTVNLTNGTPATGTLGATSVTINAGQAYASTTFLPVAAGTSAISINGTPSGYTTPSNDQSTTFTVTEPNAGFYDPSVCPWGELATSFSENVGLNEQTSCYFEPYLYATAPVGGSTVTITVSDPTKLLLTTNNSQVGSGTITQNILAGSSSGQAIYMQGLASSGTVTITETVSGYNTATATITLIPTGFIVTGGTTTTTFSTASNVNVYFVELNATTLNYSGSAYLRPGAASVTVNLTNGTPATGTLGATSVTINAGQNSASTTFLPVAAGTSAISINGTPSGYTTPSNDQSTTFTVTAPNAGFYGYGSCPWGGLATTFSENVGLNEQSGCYFEPYLYTAAPAGGRTVTLTVSDPTKLLLTTNTSQVGSGTITQNILAGSSSGQPIYMQGLASSGTVTITEAVSGYNTATATITLIPTGFIISGGGTTTTFSTASSVYVYFGELNATTLNSFAYLRPGAASVTVNLTNGTPATGTLGATSVTINAGQNSASTTFQPVAAGTSAISINGTPSGYTTPSNDQSTTFTVTAPNAGFYNPGVCPWGETATTFSENVGLNEQSGCYFEPYLFTAAPAGGRTVTVTVSDPTKLLLTTNASQVGSGTITQNILAGSSFGQAIYMQGLASSGTVTITETVSGYNTATATITLIPTGFIVTGGTTTTTFSTASNVNVYFAELNATTLNYYTSAYLRPGAASVTVNLTNGTPATGTLGATSVTINAGQNSASTTFQPVAAGTSAISINGTPRGYTTPSNDQSTTFTVTAPNAGFAGAGSCPWGGTATTFSQNVGLNEQSGCYFYPYLFTAAPTGGRTVTLTVSDPTKLLLTTNTSQVGAGTITQNLAVGASEGQAIYMQGLASSGTVTITETVSGYNTATATITLIPTGFIISGGTTTTTFSGTSSVSVLFAELNPTTLSYSSTLAYLSPGATAVTVNIANDTPATGTLGATSVTINPGQDSSYTTFLPVAAGTANIRITATPSGYTTPGNDQVTTFTVTEPSSGVTAVTVGKNLQSTTYGTLGVGAPSGGITVLLTSADSTKVLLSKSATTVGTASISYNLTSGQSQTPSFYVQAIGNPGTAQNPVTVAIMISAPGVANGSGNVTIVPSGFVFQTSNFTTHVTDTATTLTIVPSALDPTYLTSTAVQQIQPGLTNIPAMVTLTDQSGTSPVGSITVNPVTFNGADSPNSRTTSFQPLNVGSTLLGLTSPGFTTSSSQVTATVIQ